MSGFEVGAISVLVMILLIYLGMHIAVVLSLVSFIGVWFIRGSFDVALTHLWGAAAQSLNTSVLAVIPLFVLMGNLADAAGLGRDSYDIAQRLIGRIKGSLAIATVAANAIFAAITGVSVASASVFARLSVPEMLRHGYNARFAVGVVAGSSVLGMLIPPSILMIVYGVIAEQSIGDLFIAGIGPGIVLTLAYCVLIVFLAYRMPRLVMSSRPAVVVLPRAADDSSEGNEGGLWGKFFAITSLIGIVLGGIYAGFFTPVEAAAMGALVAFGIGLFRRRLTREVLGRVIVDSGNITGVVLFMIVGATMYSRMLGVSGLPTEIGNWVTHMDAGYLTLLAVYIVIVLFLGTVIDSISIMLIMVPLFMIVLQPFGVDLIWFGIVTIIAGEIGLLTPPFGMSLFVVHASLARKDISLWDVVVGSSLFAGVMFAVLLLVVAFPAIATYLVYLRY